MQARSDLISSLAVLLLIGGGFFLTTTIDLSFTSDLETFTGPRAYPRLLLSLMLVFNLIVLARAWSRMRDADAPAPAATSKNATGQLKAAAAACALIVFVVAFEPLGYILAMSPLLIVISLLFGARRRVLAVAVSLALMASCLLIFRFGLNTVLPEGLLGVDMIF